MRGTSAAASLLSARSAALCSRYAASSSSGEVISDANLFQSDLVCYTSIYWVFVACTRQRKTKYLVGTVVVEILSSFPRCARTLSSARTLHPPTQKIVVLLIPWIEFRVLSQFVAHSIEEFLVNDGRNRDGHPFIRWTWFPATLLHLAVLILVDWVLWYYGDGTSIVRSSDIRPVSEHCSERTCAPHAALALAWLDSQRLQLANYLSDSKTLIRNPLENHPYHTCLLLVYLVVPMHAILLRSVVVPVERRTDENVSFFDFAKFAEAKTLVYLRAFVFREKSADAVDILSSGFLGAVMVTKITSMPASRSSSITSS